MTAVSLQRAMPSSTFFGQKLKIFTLRSEIQKLTSRCSDLFHTLGYKAEN